MISERTLKRWRRESLEFCKEFHSVSPEGITAPIIREMEKDKRILRLTQDLLDEHLLRRKR